MGPRLRAALLGAALILPSCAAPAGQLEWDPWEGFNRKIFAFNEGFDTYALGPVAHGWMSITSAHGREWVSNFATNLLFPVFVINDVLQLRLLDAGRATARFAVNSTLGVLGILDPATPMGLPQVRADFGQTLAFWGVDEGPYLVLPIFGPSDVRDGFGLVVDFNTATLLPVPVDSKNAFFYGTAVVAIVNWRARHWQDIEEAHRAAFDYYSAVRSAWLSSRRRDTGGLPPPDQVKPAQQPAPDEDIYDVDAATKP
jgi:phospholipid-binding lipoprotein MlaA